MDNSGIFATLGVLALLVGFVLAVAALAFWVWALVDVLRHSDAEWSAAGQNKVVWLVVLIGSFFLSVPFIAALVYAVWPRPALKRAKQATATTGYGYPTV